MYNKTDEKIIFVLKNPHMRYRQQQAEKYGETSRAYKWAINNFDGLGSSDCVDG